MAFVDRVRNICVTPATEWPVIEQENTPPSELLVSYLAPLAAAGAAAGFVGSALLGNTRCDHYIQLWPLLRGAICAAAFATHTLFA